jgi:hypothetical protein
MMSAATSQNPERQPGAATAEFSLPLARSGTPARLVSLFGSLNPKREVVVRYLFDVGEPEYHVVERVAGGPLASITPLVPAAAWYERELMDQFSVEFTGHPGPRPLLFHDNWPDGIHPLLALPNEIPWISRDYRILEVQGQGICEVPVGPVHAGIIEPGHFRFSVVGAPIDRGDVRHAVMGQGRP